MPYNQEHMVMQWGGSFRAGGASGGQLEIFTGSLRFGGPGLAAANNRNTAVALSLVLQRYWVQGPARIPTNVYLEYVKWNRVGTDGRYVSDSETIECSIPPTAGTGAERYPTQVTWSTTWATDAVRGQAVRGRTYWPTSAPLANDMKVAVADCQAKATLDSELIRDLNQAARSAFVSPQADGSFPAWAVAAGFAPGTTAEGSGMSAMVMSKIGNGTSRVILRAEVGQRLDIQRRRANQQTDLRHAASA